MDELPLLDNPPVIKKEDFDRFDKTLIAAINDPWWRNFVDMVKMRRLQFLEELAAGDHPQRVEDRIRGQASELGWIILIDQAGKNKEKEKERGNGGRRQT
jgi:hypothetical protein